MSARVAAGRKATPRPTLVREEPHVAVKITARATILLVIVLVMLTFALAPFKMYLQQRSQLDELRSEASKLEKANGLLQTRIQRLSDPDYLERLARECLGMVRPGETAFVIVPKDGAAKNPDC